MSLMPFEGLYVSKMLNIQFYNINSTTHDDIDKFLTKKKKRISEITFFRSGVGWLPQNCCSALCCEITENSSSLCQYII